MSNETLRPCGMDAKMVFGETMARIASHDPSLTVVVSDYGRRLNLDEMRRRLPEAFVQCGIAEQSQVEVAAALANEGFHVVAPSYATFITARVLDQVRVLLGMMKSPVVLVGLSAGCEAGTLGASHMALEDIGCMRMIPGMTVVCPADNVELVSVLEELMRSPRPAARTRSRSTFPSSRSSPPDSTARWTRSRRASPGATRHRTRRRRSLSAFSSTVRRCTAWKAECPSPATARRR